MNATRVPSPLSDGKTATSGRWPLPPPTRDTTWVAPDLNDPSPSSSVSWRYTCSGSRPPHDALCRPDAKATYRPSADREGDVPSTTSPADSRLTILASGRPGPANRPDPDGSRRATMTRSAPVPAIRKTWASSLWNIEREAALGPTTSGL